MLSHPKPIYDSICVPSGGLNSSLAAVVSLIKLSASFEFIRFIALDDLMQSALSILHFSWLITMSINVKINHLFRWTKSAPLRFQSRNKYPLINGTYQAVLASERDSEKALNSKHNKQSYQINGLLWMFLFVLILNDPKASKEWVMEKQ